MSTPAKPTEPSIGSRSGEPILICIAPVYVPEFMPFIGPLLDKAYDKHGTREERRSIEDEIRDGRALAWIAWSGMIRCLLVTDFVREDDKLICRLRALAGRDRPQWMALLKNIEQYAEKEGCAAVRFIGRPGLRRVMPVDYRLTHVQCEKALA